MNRLLTTFAFLFVAWMAHAQTSLITGTVLDPTGLPYQNGSGVATLVPQNQQWLVNGTNPVQSPITIAALDAFGHFAVTLTNTNIISPSSANPQWVFSFCSQPINGHLPVCFTMTPMTVTANADISTQIQAQSAPLPPSGGSGSPFSLVSNPAMTTTNFIVPTNPSITGLGLQCIAGTANNLPIFQIVDSSSNNIFEVMCGGNVIIKTGQGGTVSAGDLYGALQQITYAPSITFNANGVMGWKTTLTGNVTSSSLINLPSSAYVKQLAFIICQDSTGSHSFTWPPNVINAPTVPSATGCYGYVASTDGTNAYVEGGSSSPGSGINWAAAATQNIIPKASTTGSNPNLSPSSASEDTSTTANWTIPSDALNFNAAGYVFSQAPGGSVTVGSNTVNVTCWKGLDSSFPDYFVRLSGGTGTAETVPVTGTTCTTSGFPTTGTITFTAVNTHSGAWAISSASQGAQEAINWGEGTVSTPRFVRVVIPCSLGSSVGDQQWYAPVETHGNRIAIDGGGCARIFQNHNQQGIVLGDHTVGGQYFFNTIHGLTIVPNYTGTTPQINLIQSMSRTGCPSSCVSTITFTASHDFTVGEWIVVTGMLDENSFAGIWKVNTVPTSSSITVTTISTTNFATVYGGGVAVADYVALEDNLTNFGTVETFNTSSAPSGSPAFYHYLVTVLSDQNLVLHDFNNQGSGNVCRFGNTHWAGSLIFSPGPNSPYGGILVGSALNLTPQNSCNGIDWQSGDDIYVTDSIIQGYPQFGIRAGHRRGGFGDASLKGVHFELGSVTNTFGNIGQAGIINQGEVMENDGLPPTGAAPNFLKTGNQSLIWNYYIQPVSNTSDALCTTQPGDPTRCITSYGTGPLLFAGQAFVDSSSGGSPVVTWPAIRGATSYILLRTTASSSGELIGLAQPYGSGNFLIANSSSLNPLSVCTDTICTFTDSVGLTPSSYTVPLYGSSSWQPFLDFWPSGLVMTNNGDAAVSVNGAVPLGIYTGPLQGASGTSITSIEFPGQDLIGQTDNFAVSISSPSNGSSYLFKGQHQTLANNTVSPGFAILTPAKLGIAGSGDGGNLGNIKGIYNFGTLQAYGTFPVGLMTWADSNYPKTLATSGHRPKSDTGDCESGMDATAGFYTRCGASIREYINHGADGVNWQTQATANGYTLKPHVFSFYSACSSTLEGTMASVTDSSTNTWGSTVTGGGGNHVLMYCDGTNWTVTGQ